MKMHSILNLIPNEQVEESFYGHRKVFLLLLEHKLRKYLKKSIFSSLGFYVSHALFKLSFSFKIFECEYFFSIDFQ